MNKLTLWCLFECISYFLFSMTSIFFSFDEGLICKCMTVMRYGCYCVACNDLYFFPCVIRPAWEGAMITAPLLQGVTGEEVAVQVLVVVMEAMLGTFQLVF